VSRLLACILFCLTSAFAHAAPDEDHRAWQHGVNLLRVGERLLVIWGSAGNPPRPNLGGAWPHDVYYAWLENPAARIPELPSPRLLVSRPEAQEPPSAAISERGVILMTTEDGDGGINQNAGLWDKNLNVIRKYPFRIRRGGHSGHVTAMAARFLVVYGEGWVEGGGFLDRGTGKDIHTRVVRPDGGILAEATLATGHRDSWPLVASSGRNALAVWQRFPGRTLQAALLNRSGKPLKRMQIIDGLPLRYAYDVSYAPRLHAYVVAGSSGDEGFMSLVATDGRVIRTQRGLPPMVSESRIVLSDDGAAAAYPVRPRGVAVVRLAKHSIELTRTIDHPYEWDYCGTAGAFVTPQRLLFATLSTSGLQLIGIDLP
jgi:hypothetical protein